MTRENEDKARETTSPKELEELAMDEDVEVRAEVAKNENTPLPVLEKLSKDRKTIIRDCVAGNRKTPVSVLEILSKDVNLYVEEASISPFELQKADELFVTNVIKGIVPITQYRKKKFSTEFSKGLVGKLNTKLRLAQL
mgnify:CR=1 FL=1